ncbi:MAG TPA: LuxR C-terminal-related transcriptional regulator [Anaerolineaceae bacterium]|nr:LuxR C-terminal-related transcriptional regulator [Anaerolineaceae bacterium]
MNEVKHPRNPESLLLKTKINIPRIPHEFVHRPRLTELIDRGAQGPLTLICAPAGYGKTNLLVEWTERTDLPVAWLSLDLDDNDFFRFSRYVIGALQTLDPKIGEESRDFVESTLASNVEMGATLLINDLVTLSKDIVLVLDDFQVLEDRNILHGIDFLLKHLPETLHIIIASRNEPTIELAALRAKGRVIDLGMEDLRFTGEEVGKFFHEAMGLQLPSETIQVLEKRSAGWVTGLQLAAISLRDQPDPTAIIANLKRSARYLVDFLAEEVLDKQPEDIRQFLLKTSILDTLTGPLCEAVVNPQAQPGYGMVMLNRLELINLFITPLDEQHEWYRYHPLFADFLCHIHAEINPGEIPLLQKRAAEWFEKSGNLDKAFQYAFDSGDMEWTADLIMRNLQTLIQTGAIFPLTRSIGRLPEAAIHKRPILALAYALGLIAANHLDLARYWLDDVRRQISELEDAGDLVEDSGFWNIRGGLAICESMFAVLSGDFEQAAEYSRLAASFLHEENPFVQSLIALDDSIYYVLSADTQKAIEVMRETMRIARQANNLIVMIIAICQMAYTQALQGKLGQAWATLQKSQYIVLGPAGKSLPLIGLVDIGKGRILLERGALEEAKDFLERGSQNIQNLWLLGRLDGLNCLLRLYQSLGDLASTQEVLSESSQLINDSEIGQWARKVVYAITAQLALKADNLAEAEQWWIRGGFPDLTERIPLESYPYHVYELLQLTRARFLLRKSQDSGDQVPLKIVSELLEMLLIDARRFQRVTAQIEILILLANVQDARQDKLAEDTLCQALALGEPEGYWQIYIDEGWHLSALVTRCQAAQSRTDRYLPTPAFIQRLSAALPQPVEGLLVLRQSSGQKSGPSTSRLEDGLPVRLTAREVEILKLIAEGMSNQEISARLYLAIHTVKRHVYNIFGKLEVGSRTEAVSRARHIGLLS